MEHMYVSVVLILSLVHLGSSRIVIEDVRKSRAIKTKDTVLQMYSELAQRIKQLETRNAKLEQLVENLVNSKNIKIGVEYSSNDDSVAIGVDKLQNKKRLVRRDTHVQDPYAGIALSTFAFTAALSGSTYHLSHQGETIVYHDVITNVGGAYDNMTGVFTASVDGIYAFQFTTMMEPGDQEYLELVKNGENQVSTSIQGTLERRYETTSALANLILRNGDKVWVRNFKDDQYGSGRIHGNGYSTFSGWLIGLI